MSAPILILALAGVALLVVHIRANRETITATEFREDSVYDTAVLSDGTTAFRDLGPREAPVLVIIHGATLGSVAYEEYYEPFLQGGYRVVAYDEYGRGFSDRIRILSTWTACGANSSNCLTTFRSIAPCSTGSLWAVRLPHGLELPIPTESPQSDIRYR